MGQTETTIQFDHGTELHAPELYSAYGIAEGIEGFKSVTDAQIALYHERGYLVVHNAFSEELINDAREALVDLIMGKRPDFKNLSFESQAKEVIHTLSVEQRMDAVRKLMNFCDADERLKALRDEPNLRSLMDRIVGGRSTIFQEMALIKPPRIGREKPWHQDHAYFNIPVDLPCVGVWIALDEATPENGCMHLLPEFFDRKPMLHFQRRDWQICDDQILGRKCLAVPLKPGGCLIWSSLMPHGTPVNLSGLRRRALQFHYVREGTERVDKEVHKKLFGGEAQGKQC